MNCRRRLAAALVSVAFVAGCGEDGSPTTPDNVFPAAPQGFIVSYIQQELIAWTWVPVSGASGYQIQLSRDAVFDASDETHVTTTNNFERGGLEPDTTIFARVAAFTGSPDSPNLGMWSTTLQDRTFSPPPLNLDVQLGFAPGREGRLFEGGVLKAAILVRGDLADLPEERFELRVRSDAPETELSVASTTPIRGHNRNEVEIFGLPDTVSEGPRRYRITLELPPEGVPEGVRILDGGEGFDFWLMDASAEPACDALGLDASATRSLAAIAAQGADLTFTLPEHGAIRLLDPYEPSGFGLWRPLPGLFFPTGLSWTQLADGERRGRMSLVWDGGFRASARMTGCPAVTLSCSGQTPNCSR